MTPHCPECHAPLYAGARICGYCGAPVAAERPSFGSPAPPHVNDVSAQQSTTPAPNSSRALFVVLGLVAVFVVAVGGAVVGAWLARGTPGVEEEPARVSNGLVSNSSGASMNGPTPSAPERAPAPRPTRERPAQYATPEPAPTTYAPSGRYFVMLGAFTEPAGASERLYYLRAGGYDARVIDSDEYPNMTPGLWLVVAGPFEKSYAEARAAELRAAVPDAYAKSGW